MRLVFCGTPEFAAVSLRAVVAAGHEVALVLTQPDRPAGRKLELQVSAVKQAALKLGLAVESPEKLKRNEELQRRLRAIAPDVIVVVAYGRIVPAWMLSLPRLGCVNVHGSLLPKYRGAAPIQWALANGERETGITTMLLNEGLDTGDMLLRERVPLNGAETAPEMHERLAEVGADLLLRTLDGLGAGTITPEPQNDSAATLATILTREEGRLDLARTAQQTYNRWRGFTPWPGCWGEFRGKRLLLTGLSLPEVPPPADADAGDLVQDGGALLLSCAHGSWLGLDEVKLEGKPAMPGVEFARAFQLRAGERVG